MTKVPPTAFPSQIRGRGRGRGRGRMERVIPQQWASPCNNHCTAKYAALTQIPWRVFCKKGCDGDGDTWEECLEECNELCYKDPVLKDRQWSAYIDRSPGADSYSEECFHACTSGCGYKLEIQPDKVDEARPNRPPKPPPPVQEQEQRKTQEEPNLGKPSEEVPGISA